MALALIAILAAPSGGAAQDTPRARRDRDDGPFRVFSFRGQRGRIGIVVNTAADSVKDKIGARVEAVSPGGPAADAGIKADDIITRFDGTVLGGVTAADEDESGPGMKLLELARALDPGDTVQVEYRRGSESRRATLVAEDLGGDMSFRVPRDRDRLEPWEGFQFGPDFIGPFENFGRGLFFGGPWAGLNLVTMDADLAEYFGTREGVLVVKASGDSALPLKSGDVLLAIDGRKPDTPEHAMRILRSYESGEAVKLDIMRQKRRSTVTWTVPDRDRVRVTRPRARVRQEF
jgi:S1-C subfamily serine protease